MRPEAAFVLALARGEGGRIGIRGDGGLDWDLVADLAARHQVDALCSWMGRSLGGFGEAGQGLERGLRMSYLHHRLRNEALERDLAGIHDALSTRGIEALFFKGPWLALHAYPDPGTRPVGDIDLGIQEADYAGVVAALVETGYAPIEPVPSTPEEALRRAHYGRQIRFHARGKRPVEIHFRLVNIGPPILAERWVWDTARPLSVASRALLVPGPQATLLHLLLHANQHSFAVLRLLHDIRWALERDAASLDPEEFAARVRELRCNASCYHGLVLARDLAGAPATESLTEALRPSKLRRTLFAQVWRLPAVRRLEGSRSRMAVESPLLYFLEMGRIRDRILFLKELVAEAGGPVPFARRALDEVGPRDGRKPERP